jgi:CDP-diacylglycerol--glycerol-3-phosphate 3-phosphatidyltransferase
MIIIIWISDLLDGYIARKRDEVSELGKIIDPLADKFCVISISITLLVQDVIPLWFVLIIVLRDVIIFSGGLFLKRSKNVVLMSNWIGKISVFIIGLTLLFSIFFMHFKNNQIFFSYHTENLELYLKFLIILSITMSIVSLIVYFKRFYSIVYKKIIK